MPEIKQKESPHIPVLLKETIDTFSAMPPKGTFIDCTLGYAGHSEEILKHYPNISLIGIDRDKEALEFSSNRLKNYKNRSQFIQGSFSKIIPEILNQRDDICGILADFGVSSLQLDKKERGFSFLSETLDMRMDSNSPFSAYDVVNDYSTERLTEIFYKYGEIKQSRKLAQKIAQNRPISSGKELADIILSVIPKRGKTHPATQIFQAIRIEVNDELGEIERLLDALESNPPSSAVVSLITFHSLEDRIVKNRFKEWSKNCICPPNVMRCECGNSNALGKQLNKKPISATAEEIKINPRSRSAKLRAFKFKDKR